MKKHIVIKKLAVPVVLLGMMTGCYFGGSVDSLLSPPKLSDEQNQIFEALVSTIGESVNLVYPKGGEFKSPYIIQNIDDEPDVEAIVFYRTAEETDGSNIRINFLDKKNGKWQSVFDNAGIGIGIDRIIFSNLGDSDKTSIIIGYSMLSNEKNVKVYEYTNGIISSVYTDYYSNMFVADLENNSTNELIILHPNIQTADAYISSVVSDNGTVKESSLINMNTDSTEFINIAHGFIGINTPALFIDSLTTGQLVTEIIYMINGQLRNPVYINNNELLEQTMRPRGYLCTDIDLDGVVEIPTLTLFTGYNTDSTEKEYITNWNIFENYSITKKYQTYYNPDEGYCFMLPSRWDNVVTAKTDKSTGEIVFYKYDLSIESSTTELLRFLAADSSTVQIKLESGYSEIKKGRISYLYKSAIDENEPLILTETEIINNFYIMSAE